MTKFLLLIALVLVYTTSFTQTPVFTLDTDQFNSKNLSYTTDNKYFAFSNANHILIYKSSSEQLYKEITSSLKSIEDFEFTEDQKAIVLVGRSGNGKTSSLEWQSLENPAENFLIPLGKKDIIASALFPGKKKIVLSSKDRTIQLWDMERKALEQTINTSGIVLDTEFSPDGKYLAVGSNDRKVIIYRTEDYEIVNSFEHEDWVQDIEFSNNGKYLASVGLDGNLYLTDLEESYKTTSIKHIPGTWYYSLDFSDDDQYIATGSDRKGVHIWNIKDKLFYSELNYSREGTIRSIQFNTTGQLLATSDEFEKNVKLWDVSNLNITPQYDLVNEDDKTPPQIYISSPANLSNDRVQYSEDIIQIKGLAIDDSGVQSLIINGTKTPIKDNGDFVINLPLIMGDNFITIEVQDINQNIALKKFIVNRRDLNGEVYDPKAANNYLFIIGIDTYKYWPTLNNAVKDANDIASTLMSTYNFEFQNISILKDEQATRSNIYKGLRSMIEKIGPQDNLMLYFSGHGYFDELLNEGYWVPVDAEKSEPGDYISNSDILNIIKNIDSQHTFLVADACFSGSLFLDQNRGYAENVEKFRSRWALASGRLEVVSDGSVGSNSPFASTFIKFLRENDKDKVAVSELVQYVKLAVSEISEQTPIGNPLKSVGDEGGEFVFYKKGN